VNFYQELIDATQEQRKYLLASPVIRDALEGTVTREEYVAFLTQAYYHVSQTVPLLMACGARLPARLEWLRKAVIDYLNEEYGHQEWVLEDIAEAGGDAGAVRGGSPAPATAAMISCAWDVIQRGNPVGFFGMVFVLEGTSVALATLAADRLRSGLGLPKSAFTYLYSHGSLDEEHVDFLESLMDRLEAPADRAAVIDAARRFFLLYAGIFREIPRSGQQDRSAA
jgi:pyrroloquinoline quinone (PQQ) biosynthesis protein C